MVRLGLLGEPRVGLTIDQSGEDVSTILLDEVVDVTEDSTVKVSAVSDVVGGG